MGLRANMGHWAHRVSTPLRRRHYCGESGSSLVRTLPPTWRRKLGLADESAVGSRRIEVGGGPFPQPGYVHVDIDRHARHLEAFAPAWKLPFPDAWATEILAIHSLEHVHPRMLVPTLREWHRVLAPNGRVQIHVPNTEELTASFLASPVEDKWRVMGALLGMYSHAGVHSAEELEVDSDHQITFDWPLLCWALESAGFQDIVDRTGEVSDTHTELWTDAVAHFSLIAQASKAGA